MTRVYMFIISLIMSFLSIFFPTEKPFEMDTVEFDGVTYQNDIVPQNMYLKREYELYDKEPLYSKYVFSLLGGYMENFYKLEGNYIYKSQNTSYNSDVRSWLYCPQDEWEEKHSYYADDNNYVYYYEVWIGNEEGVIHNVKNADIDKFNEILEFDIENGYLTATFPTAERITLPSKSTPRIRFYKESKDGFIETHTSTFIIYDGTLYLYRYYNGSTGMIEVSVVPQELRTYFSDVLKDGGYKEYFQ